MRSRYVFMFTVYFDMFAVNKILFVLQMVKTVVFNNLFQQLLNVGR